MYIQKPNVYIFIKMRKKQNKNHLIQAVFTSTTNSITFEEREYRRVWQKIFDIWKKYQWQVQATIINSKRKIYHYGVVLPMNQPTLYLGLIS